jgi:hypothetical protein
MTVKENNCKKTANGIIVGGLATFFAECLVVAIKPGLLDEEYLPFYMVAIAAGGMVIGGVGSSVHSFFKNRNEPTNEPLITDDRAVTISINSRV